MTTSCIFGRILCFCSSLFGPVSLFLLLLIWQLLLLWSRFMWDFSALFLPHGRQYIPISPAQELGHLSLQLNRTTAILHYFKRMIIFFSSGAVLFWSLLFQKVNIRKSHLKKSHLVVLRESITHLWWVIRESRLSILYIVVALMDNLGSQVKAHLLPEPHHWLRANNCFFKKHSYNKDRFQNCSNKLHRMKKWYFLQFF